MGLPQCRQGLGLRNGDKTYHVKKGLRVQHTSRVPIGSYVKPIPVPPRDHSSPDLDTAIVGSGESNDALHLWEREVKGPHDGHTRHSRPRHGHWLEHN